MTELEKAARQALEALETGTQHGVAIDALRRALQERSSVEQQGQTTKSAVTAKEAIELFPEVAYWYSEFLKHNTVSEQQEQQEPVAWKDKTYGNLHHQDFGNSIPLYTRPPAREPLTDEEIKAVIASIDPEEQYMPKALRQFARAIEAAHGIGEKK